VNQLEFLQGSLKVIGVKPTAENQTIFGDQAHMWVEVKFKECWVEFDPTPLGLAKKIPTYVEITGVNDRIVEGENFSVGGLLDVRMVLLKMDLLRSI